MQIFKNSSLFMSEAQRNMHSITVEKYSTKMQMQNQMEIHGCFDGTHWLSRLKRWKELHGFGFGKRYIHFIRYRSQACIFNIPFPKIKINNEYRNEDHIELNMHGLDFFKKKKKHFHFEILANELTTVKSFTNVKCLNNNFGLALGGENHFRQRLWQNKQQHFFSHIFYKMCWIFVLGIYAYNKFFWLNMEII